MPIRLDRHHFDKGILTAQGFLRAPAFLTRTGVFNYRKQDGTLVRELRHPDDVFDKASLDSLQMAPLTDDHPKEFVTPENVKLHAIGWVNENIKVDENKISAQVIIADKNSIDRVDKGKVELSCAYLADLIEEKGTFDGEEYDFRQKNIRYNHVALVERGRAGPQVRLRLDSNDAEIEITDKGFVEMKKIKLGGKEFEVTQEIFDAFQAECKRHSDSEDELKAKVVAAETATTTAETKITELETEKKDAVDKLQARVDSLEEKLKTHKDGLTSEEINAAVRERIKLENVANVILPGQKFDAETDASLMKKIVEKHSPATDFKDKSEVYIKARFDGIVEELDGRDSRRTQLGVKIADSRKDDEFDADAARKKSMDADKDAWKQPLSTSTK